MIRMFLETVFELLWEFTKPHFFGKWHSCYVWYLFGAFDRFQIIGKIAHH